jgi:hypothetical protein
MADDDDNDDDDAHSCSTDSDFKCPTRYMKAGDVIMHYGGHNTFGIVTEIIIKPDGIKLHF